MAGQPEGKLMGAGKSVKLPEHLWSALDEMARDAALKADALVETAVEQFVALQGYELAPGAPASAPAATAPEPIPEPAATPPDPQPPPSRDSGPVPALQDDEDSGLARTAARPALASQEFAEVEREPARLTGIGPTHVPVKPKPEPAAPPAPSSAPVPPSAPKPSTARERAVPAPPAPLPEWVNAVARTDADEERSAARERMAAIDREVERLTIERPTTTPLGGSGDGDEADEA